MKKDNLKFLHRHLNREKKTPDKPQKKANPEKLMQEKTKDA